MVKIMRKKKFLFLAFMSVLSMVARAQSSEDYSLAMDVLKGKTDVKSRQWAIETLENCQDSVFRPRALNTLGVAYMRGLGVEPDTVKAVSCFETAGQLGCVSGYYNLGMYYKYLPREKQDFSRALSCFEAGMKLESNGSDVCAYDAGFMYYKGLGCQQDYTKAVELFRKGAVKGLSYCKYMIGLCYRNGYGVEQDSDLAKAYLEDAAFRHSYRPAILELRRNEPEVISPSYIYDMDGGLDVETMPVIDPVTFTPNEIYGEYNGLLLTYDWSGQKIVKEQPLSVAMWKGQNDNIIGKWILGDDTLDVTSTISENGILSFSDTEIEAYERYCGKDKVKYAIDKLLVSNVCNCLTGELRLYSLELSEPDRPMFVCLSKDVDGINVDDKYSCKIYAYPVADNQHFEVRFLLPEDTKQNVVCLYSQMGTPVKRFKIGELHAGKQTIQLPFDVSSGNYVVMVKADQYHGNSIINKK